MAKELSEFPTTRGRRKGDSKYPWDEWFDGKIRQLDVGEDFDAKIESFRSTISGAAKDRGIRVRTATTNGGKSIVVQALLDSDDENLVQR